MKSGLYILLILLLGSPLQSSAQSTIQDRWPLVQQYLDQQAGLSGIVVIGHGGEIKLNRGFGYADRKQNIPYTDQTLATIGSITKPFTATAIMILYEQGKLHPSDLASRYFDNMPDDKKEMTLHHLLTHSSGLPGAIGDDYAATTDASFLEQVWSAPLAFPPGKGYLYSNVGYSLLGLIIEKVSGTKYGDFLEQYIFQPAGMTTAGYRNPDAPYHLLTHGYQADGSDWGTSHDKNWNGNEPYWHLKANGGLLMSARDMYQWYLALRANKVLRPTTLAFQTQPYVDEQMGGSFYSYGYAVDPEGYCIQHNGGNRIFKADFRWFPKLDMFLFAASNDANVRLFRLCDELVRILETGELPLQEKWISGDMDRFPANENELTARHFTELLQDFSPEKAGTFLDRHCSTGLIERNGRARLLDIFEMLRTDTGGQPFSSFQVWDEHIKLFFPVAGEPAVLKVSLYFKDHQIDRLSAEIEAK